MPGYSESIRNARLDLITSALDAGSGPGVLQIYAGNRPTTGTAVTDQTLLGTLTFSSPAAPAASGGILTFSTITQDDAADTDGTATWARAADSDGTFVGDFSVGAIGSGADIELNVITIVESGPISIATATITAGNG